MELSDTRAGSDHPVMARPAPIHIWRILSVTTPWTWQLQPAPLFLLQRLFLGIGAGFLNIPSQKLKRNYWIWDAETFWFDCLSDWWFGNIFYFPFHIWDNPSHCLIFFKMVETTNQLLVSFSARIGGMVLFRGMLNMKQIQMMGVWSRQLHGQSILGA